jgi:phage-related protein
VPETEVVMYAEDDGSSPYLDWLDRCPPKVQDKCIVWVEQLKEKGHELRRPLADTLRDGIHELRVRFQRVNYRILYFFHDQKAVITHGLVKEQDVPPGEIDLAIRRRTKYQNDPKKHTYSE